MSVPGYGGPVTFRGLLRQAGGLIGRRGAFLAFLALLDTSYGYILLTIPPALQSLDLMLPWRAWAILWLATGGICLTGVFARRDLIQYTLAAALKTAWALLYVRLAAVQHVPYAWISAIVFLALAATVLLISSWPETVTVPAPGPAFPGGPDDPAGSGGPAEETR